MRFYKDFPEAQNEIRRDLKELGVQVHTETMQHFDISDDPDYGTVELQNYMYSVTKPDFQEVEGVHEEWVEQEWKDRLNGGLNPGHAWKKRKDVWLPMLEFQDDWARQREKGTFSYTYSMRMGGTHIRKAIEELEKHPNSRQIWIPVWKTDVDEDHRGLHRVPCSLGYFLLQRGGQLHLTYVMRSCDFATHYANDVALATMLQSYVALHTDLAIGTFTHVVFSLHVYNKDVKDVF